MSNSIEYVSKHYPNNAIHERSEVIDNSDIGVANTYYHDIIVYHGQEKTAGAMIQSGRSSKQCSTAKEARLQAFANFLRTVHCNNAYRNQLPEEYHQSREKL